MTPLDFITDIGNDYNMSVGEWQELMKKDIQISSGDAEWIILSYYNMKGHMVLDIGKKQKKEKK